jgi:hypothetical protein
MKTCLYCNAPIPDKKLNYGRIKYCSIKCQKESYHKKYLESNVPRAHNRNLNIPGGTTGAIHELQVCADLLSRGYHVYRSQSQHAPCDIVIIANDKLLRVEVTTGQKYLKGWSYPPRTDRHKYDVLAIGFPDGEIKYINDDKTEFIFP